MRFRGHTLIETLIVLILTSLISLIAFNFLDHVNKFQIILKEENTSEMELLRMIFYLKHDIIQSQYIDIENDVIHLEMYDMEVSYWMEKNKIVRKSRGDSDSTFSPHLVYDWDAIRKKHAITGVEIKVDSPVSITITAKPIPTMYSMLGKHDIRIQE